MPDLIQFGKATVRQHEGVISVSVQKVPLSSKGQP